MQEYTSLIAPRSRSSRSTSILLQSDSSARLRNPRDAPIQVHRRVSVYGPAGFVSGVTVDESPVRTRREPRTPAVRRGVASPELTILTHQTLRGSSNGRRGRNGLARAGSKGRKIRGAHGSHPRAPPAQPPRAQHRTRLSPSPLISPQTSQPHRSHFSREKATCGPVRGERRVGDRLVAGKSGRRTAPDVTE